MNENKILIIPDTHGRTFWKDAVHGREEQLIIFLGDYVDPYSYEGISVEDAMSNFEEIIDFKKKHMSNVVLLLGNHDLGYFFSTSICECRHSYRYANDIKSMFTDNRELFQIAYQTFIGDQLYVFSHAGIVYEWLDETYYKDKYDKEQVVNFLNKQYNQGNPYKEFIHALSIFSDFRGWGGMKWGSCIWSDILEWFRIDKPTFLGYQIFGHSQLEKTGEPLVGENFALLDCRAAFELNEQKQLIEVSTNKIYNL